ncbi:MAG: chromosome segregation SMC family protein [Candidatus Pacearchaeota archaeon]
MTYIKKLVIHGFKSFAQRTELLFDKDINVIIGPNGSGKSNVADALCFVLGRLGSKSLRAVKSSNFLFQGTHERKPAHEAFVELIFDNSKRSFNINSDELSIKRILRRNGVSIYKINNEIKTRQEILEILSQIGIDPNGFNIILQGNIAHFVKMRGEERREIIEEIAGISIYESRKQKALHEIEKTEQKLKEVGAVLRERTSYLKNLEEERKQALRYKELEKIVKQCKASIIKKKMDEKEKEISSISKDIEKNNKWKEKVREEIEEINSDILKTENRINEINKHIQKTTGFERESLNEEVTNLNAKIAAEKTRKENFEKRLSENEIRKKELENYLIGIEKEITDLKKESPKMSKRHDEIKKKKLELEKYEEEKNKWASMENEFESLKDRIRDKEKLLNNMKNDSKIIYNLINSLSSELTTNSIEMCESIINELKDKIEKLDNDKNELSNQKIKLEKNLSVFESEIEKSQKLIKNIPDSSICPLCRCQLTPDHKNHVIKEARLVIEKTNKEISSILNDIKKIEEKNSILVKEIATLKNNLSLMEKELIKLNSIEEKKGQLKKLIENEKLVEKEVNEMIDKRNRIEKRLNEKTFIDEKYDKLFYELQELSSRTDQNLDTAIIYKEREADGTRNALRGIDKDKVDLEKEINRISEDLRENLSLLEKKQKALVQLGEQFKKMYEERTILQDKIKEKNMLLVNKQNALNRLEESINNNKINIARVSAEKESLEFELAEFSGTDFIHGSIENLKEKLEKTQRDLAIIGSVNLRALETYDTIKLEYEKVSERAAQLEKERDEILKVIQEIDNKKRKTFLKAFNSLNELFTRNFSQLSVKGKAFLEIENPDNIFEGGVGITIKVAKGKYFDVTSLSGGEQTLVALSLIFAIQEYKPYAFYILDEIDASLDKKNSELLSNLLKKYIQTGQYIIISHNDSIISGADVIYGVSMNHGVSKVISLEVRESKTHEKNQDRKILEEAT